MFCLQEVCILSLIAREWINHLEGSECVCVCVCVCVCLSVCLSVCVCSKIVREYNEET